MPSTEPARRMASNCDLTIARHTGNSTSSGKAAAASCNIVEIDCACASAIVATLPPAKTSVMSEAEAPSIARTNVDVNSSDKLQVTYGRPRQTLRTKSAAKLIWCSPKASCASSRYKLSSLYKGRNSRICTSFAMARVTLPDNSSQSAMFK